MADEKEYFVDTKLAMIREERRYKLAPIGQWRLGDVIRGIDRVTWEDLPDDAYYLGARFDPLSDSVLLLWGHETFPPSPEGQTIERFGPAFVEPIAGPADD